MKLIQLLQEARFQEIVHKNPSVAVLKTLAKNNKYHSARFVIYNNGDVVAADSENFTHDSMAPAHAAWEIRGYIQYLGDNEYAYRSMEVYSPKNKDHSLFRMWERAGIQNGNPDIVEETLLEGKSTPCIVVDVQPEYSGMNDGDSSSVFEEIIRFVNNQTGKVLMFVNAEDQGLTGDTIQDIKQYWEDSGFDSKNWNRVQIVDKGYGYLRSAMDYGIEPSSIIRIIRELYNQKQSDSRDLIIPSFGKRIEQQTIIKYALEELGDDNITVNWVSVKQLKQFSGAYIMGGGRNECLREIELLMNAFNIKYKRINSLVY